MRVEDSAARAELSAQPRQRRVRPSGPEDAAAITALMSEAGLRSNTEPRHLHWKYWQERPEWAGSRSYVLTDGSAVLAHAGVMPAILLADGKRLRLAHVIDWAARRSEVGAGVALMKHVGRLTEGLYAIGGSADTVKILPQIGFRACGAVSGYVRPLSPLNLWREAGVDSWRIVPRMARSMLWLMTASRPSLAGWSVRPLAESESDQVAPVLPQARAGAAVLERSEALFRYMLACPIVPMMLHAVEYAGRVRGYFLLALAGGQTRLADAWVDSREPTDWCALVGCAVREASRRKEAVELVAWSSAPQLAQALADNGFHQRFTLPVMLRGGAQAALAPPLRVQMLDNDALYLYEGRDQLWI
jgi:hypothetical protein